MIGRFSVEAELGRVASHKLIARPVVDAVVDSVVDPIVDGAFGVVVVVRFRWSTHEGIERLCRASARGSAAAVFLLELLQLMLKQPDGFGERGQINGGNILAT